MGRKRKQKNKRLPKYLYANGKNYIYKRPDIPPMGMGSDLAVAIRAAEEINQRLEKPEVAQLLNRFEGKAAMPMAGGRPGTVLFPEVSAAWLKHYIEERRPASSTLAN